MVLLFDSPELPAAVYAFGQAAGGYTGVNSRFDVGMPVVVEQDGATGFDVGDVEHDVPHNRDCVVRTVDVQDVDAVSEFGLEVWVEVPGTAFVD
jgi:hypothetical protein